MHAALRLARQNVCRTHPCTKRTLATTATPSAHVVGSSTSPAKPSIIPLSNVEAQWAKLTSEEKMTVHEQLEEIQKKDWKELSIDEKKAGKYDRWFCFFCCCCCCSCVGG
jgi:cytochrome c oxidase subunit 4